MENVAGECVVVVSTDLRRCEEIVLRFRLEGYRSTFFAEDAGLFQAWEKLGPHLVMLDVRMNSLLAQLSGRAPPVIGIARRQDFRDAVDSMKCGVLDVLFDPIDPDYLLLAAKKAIHGSPSPRLSGVKISTDLSRLTPREQDVLHLIANGQSNKEAGRELGISPRTIEVHRARVMQKFGARNTADLMRIVLG